ncbi:hypothetical protein L596_004706 [Steinernema carpocapsae]|uniref:Uncharacterized protein n=1 Tax=Steinernema carpocapsae TaxID=34508 RepID=A0A4U8UWT0_STECR|nr:hypothetical protein L596_004706 [Steinernema carpocapsae]
MLLSVKAFNRSYPTLLILSFKCIRKKVLLSVVALALNGIVQIILAISTFECAFLSSTHAPPCFLDQNCERRSKTETFQGPYVFRQEFPIVCRKENKEAVLIRECTCALQQYKQLSSRSQTLLWPTIGGFGVG